MTPMKEIYFGENNLITSLGFTTAEHLESIMQGKIGIRLHDDPSIFPDPVQASRIPDPELNDRFQKTVKVKPGQGPFTRLEKIFLLSVSDVIEHCGVDLRDPRTLLVISSTKGNIDLLDRPKQAEFGYERLFMWKMAETIAGFFGCPNPPVVVSSACISGSLAIITAARLLQAGLYDHAVVTGGDLITEFVVSGFQSFQALSLKPCRPFDAQHDGLSLGEGCGTLVMSVDPGVTGHKPAIRYLGGATSNDANHISGPSRDGEGLWLAIKAAMSEASVGAEEVDFISAHGTGTLYNDEMEALAINRSGLIGVPINSFKGYFGHTLGAAGIIESVLTLCSMRQGILFKSAGYEKPGVSVPVNIIDRHLYSVPETCLKTASGFGGCNAALIFESQ